MRFSTIPLAAKVGIGSAVALAVTGGAALAVAHLTTNAAQAATPASAATPIVASPSPTKATPNPAARAVAAAAEQAEAQVLGISVKQLRADFKQGQSVQQLAAQKGLTEAQFDQQLLQDVKPLLDQDVSGGTITSAQEQAALKRLGKTIPGWVRPSPKPSPSPSPS